MPMIVPTSPMQSPMHPEGPFARQLQKEGRGPERHNVLNRSSLILAASTFTVAVFLFTCFAYNFVFLWRILPARGKDEWVLPLMLIYNLLWMLSFWSYVKAYLTEPGVMPERWREFVATMGESLDVVAPKMMPPGWQPGKATLCRKCLFPRPERAHHCQICGFCVLRYDHHCPWINNCVGFQNHKYFLLLGVYSFLGSVFTFTSSLPELVECVWSLMATPWDGQYWRELRLADAVVFLISCALTCIVLVFLTTLLSVHIPLAMRNLTTVEENYDNIPNPFDQGGKAENLAQIFGAYGWDWFFPIAPRRALSDGVLFSRSDDFRNSDGLPDAMGDMTEAEVEHLWRLRYQVAGPLPKEHASTWTNDGPFASLARWWTGSSPSAAV
jgi:palmitoyltransferase